MISNLSVYQCVIIFNYCLYTIPKDREVNIDNNEFKERKIHSLTNNKLV